MSEYERCRVCGEWGWMASHQCPPMWDIYCPDHGDDAETARAFYGTDAEDAVEKWAERADSDSAEYSIVGGQPATVFVRPAGGDGAWEKWVVEGEAVPEYRAHKEPPS